MYLRILSLRGVQYEGEVAGLSVKTLSGEITVLNNHRPLITSLKKGTAHIITSGGERKPIEISSGFLEKDANNKLNLLVD
ncbi:MAG: F0F1 ATP synthase subunit epsilon [Candidatus Vogelbacteria bacterium]|nr:F0F1 ATP synthase subunit epsilon [Candidatus Vogelbacteria bacterium]